MFGQNAVYDVISMPMLYYHLTKIHLRLTLDKLWTIAKKMRIFGYCNCSVNHWSFCGNRTICQRPIPIFGDATHEESEIFNRGGTQQSRKLSIFGADCKLYVKRLCVMRHARNQIVICQYSFVEWYLYINSGLIESCTDACFCFTFA